MNKELISFLFILIMKEETLIEPVKVQQDLSFVNKILKIIVVLDK